MPGFMPGVAYDAEIQAAEAAAKALAELYDSTEVFAVQTAIDEAVAAIAAAMNERAAGWGEGFEAAYTNYGSTGRQS